MKQCFYTDNYGPNQKVADDSMNWLIDSAFKRGMRGFVYIPTSDGLDLKTLGITISQLAGEKSVKEMILVNETNIKGVRIILLDEDNRVKDAGVSPLLALYPPWRILNG